MNGEGEGEHRNRKSPKAPKIPKCGILQKCLSVSNSHFGHIWALGNLVFRMKGGSILPKGRRFKFD